MKEYGSFILVATVGASAKEDVVVHIDAGEDADKYENLPSELVVKALGIKQLNLNLYG